METRIIQVSDGRDKAFYKATGNSLQELKSYELSKHFPAVKTIKVTLEFDLDDKDLVTELLASIQKINSTK